MTARRMAFGTRLHRSHPALSPAVRQARRHYMQGERLAFRGDTDGAIREWQRALELKPGSFVTEQELSRALSHHAAMAEALRQSTDSGTASQLQIAQPATPVSPAESGFQAAAPSAPAPVRSSYQVAFRPPSGASSQNTQDASEGMGAPAAAFPVDGVTVSTPAQEPAAAAPDLSSPAVQVAVGALQRYYNEQPAAASSPLEQVIKNQAMEKQRSLAETLLRQSAQP